MKIKPKVLKVSIEHTQKANNSESNNEKLAECSISVAAADVTAGRSEPQLERCVPKTAFGIQTASQANNMTDENNARGHDGGKHARFDGSTTA